MVAGCGDASSPGPRQRGVDRGLLPRIGRPGALRAARLPPRLPVLELATRSPHGWGGACSPGRLILGDIGKPFRLLVCILANALLETRVLVTDWRSEHDGCRPPLRSGDPDRRVRSAKADPPTAALIAGRPTKGYNLRSYCIVGTLSSGLNCSIPFVTGHFLIPTSCDGIFLSRCTRAESMRVVDVTRTLTPSHQGWGSDPRRAGTGDEEPKAQDHQAASTTSRPVSRSRRTDARSFIHDRSDGTPNSRSTRLYFPSRSLDSLPATPIDF